MNGNHLNFRCLYVFHAYREQLQFVLPLLLLSNTVRKITFQGFCSLLMPLQT